MMKLLNICKNSSNYYYLIKVHLNKYCSSVSWDHHTFESQIPIDFLKIKWVVFFYHETSLSP